jgi:oligosaccharyltransferase complex subunit alpha (ribophorin I)
MAMKLYILVLLSLCIGVSLAKNLEFSLVTRNIDLSTQNARHSVILNVANSGPAITSFDYTIEEPLASHLASYQALSESGPLPVSSLSEVITKDGKSYRSFSISTKLETGATNAITVNLVFTHVQTPFPVSISQFDNQLVKYSDNHFLFTPYHVESQKTTIKLASAKVESYTELSPFNLKGNTLTYGQYTNVAPFSSSPFTVHFENNSPFLTITTLTKEIEVSHYGNVAVEETYEWVHTGARLAGEFSRYDYQRQPGGAASAIRIGRDILPPFAADIYYRDDIGNISTSHVIEHPEKTVLELIPRFPLLGGWKTQFYMGYNIPLYEVVKKDTKSSDLYGLFIDVLPVFDVDYAIDEMTVSVILPEGATNIQLKSPWNAAIVTDKRFTYLDTSGRPVTTFVVKNLVGTQPGEIEVTYNFPSSRLYTEPFLLVGAIFVLFFVAIIGVRVRLSITPEQSNEQENDKKIKVLLDDLSHVCEKINKHLEVLLNSDNARGSQGKAALDAAKAMLSQSYSELNRIRTGFEEIDEDLAGVVTQIIKLTQDKESYIKKLGEQEALFRKKSIVATVYETTKAQLEANYKTVSDELATLVADLTGQ